MVLPFPLLIILGTNFSSAVVGIFPIYIWSQSTFSFSFLCLLLRGLVVTFCFLVLKISELNSWYSFRYLWHFFSASLFNFIFFYESDGRITQYIFQRVWKTDKKENSIMSLFVICPSNLKRYKTIFKRTSWPCRLRCTFFVNSQS